MHLDTFFEKFELFADAPDAVAKMRELVLHFALHGGFSGDDSKLWKLTQLDELLEVQNGFAFKSALFNQVNKGMPLIRIRDISKADTQVYYSGDYREEFIVKRGDLIIGMDGNFNIHRWRGLDALLNQRVCRLRHLSPQIDDQFLFYFVQEHLDEIHRNTTYTTVKHISSKQIKAIQLPLPPLAEQKRIVAKVDALMALCDQLEAQQQERDTRQAALARASLARFADAPTPANLNLLFHPNYTINPADLRKSILTLAVQGKLVPQDPGDEAASRLLEKIESDRSTFAETHKFRSATAKIVDEHSLPFSVPGSWRWCRLSSIFNAVTDGDHLPPPKSDNGVAFLTIGNITTGTLQFDGCRFVPEAYYSKLAYFRRPIPGDILYTVVGATYGRPALVETDRPFCVQRHIAILKPPQHIEVGYLLAMLRSPLTYDQATASTTGTAQPTVPLGALRNFIAPLPPLAEQRRIVAKVNQLMALVDELETQLEQSRTTAKNLLEALLTELT